MGLLLAILLGYALGALPIGFALTQSVKGIDLRRTGSGNVGAANAYRTAGPLVALLVVAADVTKGAASVLIAARLSSDGVAPVAAGVAAVVGHVYPVWLRFHGGKGVATACGAFAVLAPLATAIAAGIFVAVVGTTRYVSAGSLAAAAALPALAWMTRAPLSVVAGGLLTALLIAERHRGNVVRLREGRERRIGYKE